MSQITVDIQHATTFTPLPSDADITRWGQHAVTHLHRDVEITVRLVDEPEIQRLNATYRGKDKPTNVLSFPVDLPPGIQDDLLGDIVICPAIVMAEATMQHKSYDSHFAHMIIHGCLHLMGFDHVTAEQANIMEPKEIELMAALQFPNPYQGIITHE